MQFRGDLHIPRDWPGLGKGEGGSWALGWGGGGGGGTDWRGVTYCGGST